MSRAFVKDDAPNERLVIPPRAPLPEGTPNRVTARGLTLLKAEYAELSAEVARLQETKGDEAEVARQLALIRGKLEALNERLSSAELVTRETASDEVGFGATVTVRWLSGRLAGQEDRIRIVGVDEAAGDETAVAFTAPIADALLGRKVGETAQLVSPRGKQALEVIALG